MPKKKEADPDLPKIDMEALKAITKRVLAYKPKKKDVETEVFPVEAARNSTPKL